MPWKNALFITAVVLVLSATVFTFTQNRETAPGVEAQQAEAESAGAEHPGLLQLTPEAIAERSDSNPEPVPEVIPTRTAPEREEEFPEAAAPAPIDIPRLIRDPDPFAGYTGNNLCNFRADERVREDVNAFEEFERLLPLVKDSANEESASKVREALNNGKSVWLTVAAVEAIRQGEVDEAGCGKVFLDDLLALLDEEHEELHEEQFVTLNVLACLGAMAEKGDEEVVKIVKAIVGWQRWSENEVVRLRDMADRVLLKLTGEDCTLNEKTLGFWDWWVANEGRAKADDKPPERQSKTAPVVFKEPIVGTRTIFVIDTSDSMKWDINEEDKERLAKEVPHLDWDDIDSPMDLAIAELVHSLEQLQQEKKPNRDERKTGTKEHMAYPHFAIITYNTEVEMLTPGWVPASKSEIKDWIRDVKKLEPEYTTNIHGALKMSMGLNEGDDVSARPALDKNCLLHGAHTIVFLTDGYPTWSDDSNDRSAKNEFGHPVGDGEYVKRDKLLELARHLNRFRKVIINTVGIGAHDRELMKGLAKDSGGNYTNWECRIEWK